MNKSSEWLFAKRRMRALLIWENNPPPNTHLQFRELKFLVPEPPLSAPNLFFSFLRMFWAGSSWGTSILMKFLSALCTWRVPKESIWADYFPPFFSPPFTMLGINSGHFRTGLLVSIFFHVITNSTEPGPKLVSGWKIAEVQRLHPNWYNVSKWKKQEHCYQIGFSVSQRQCCFWQGSIQNTSTDENVRLPALSLPTVCGRATSEATQRSLKIALRKHGVASTSQQ